jgi:hypothetical protein
MVRSWYLVAVFKPRTQNHGLVQFLVETAPLIVKTTNSCSTNITFVFHIKYISKTFFLLIFPQIRKMEHRYVYYLLLKPCLEITLTKSDEGQEEVIYFFNFNPR